MIRTDGRPTVAHRGGHPDDQDRCPTCKGTGACEAHSAMLGIRSLLTCPDCHGRGHA